MNLEILNRYYEEGWLIKQNHPELPLTIWNYSQTTQYEGKWDEITLQCRGLVTWSDQDGILARPFKKFFNWEENKHTPTKDFDVYEKLDGSLILAFHLWGDWMGDWILASRGSFTSDQAKAASKLFHSKYGSVGMNTDATYLFEYTAPTNRIVVDYGPEEKLTLLGAIRTEDGFEAPWWHLELVAKSNGFNLVRKFNGIKDFSELKNSVGDNEEGYVIRFSNGDRMKIKGEEYIRLHKIMTNVSSTSIWEILSTGGNMEDLLKNVPDEFYNKIKEEVRNLAIRFNFIRSMCLEHYAEIVFKVGTEDRKAFAEEALKFKYPSILFSLLNKKDINPTIWKIVKPEWRKI